MIVAGIDTATPSTVVGVLLGDGGVAEARDDPQEGGRAVVRRVTLEHAGGDRRRIEVRAA